MALCYYRATAPRKCIWSAVLTCALLLVFQTERGASQPDVTCYTSATCTGSVLSSSISATDCCVGAGISYDDGVACFECIAVVIGFGEVSYNVNEGDGSVSITFGVLSGTLGVSVDVSVSTRDGSALSSFDYSYNTSSYTLSPASPNQTFTIAIVDDSLLENLEYFFGGLTIVTTGFIATISPNETTINIIDKDNVRIGFVEGSYSVGEAAGTVSVSAGVLEGELGISTTFRLITADGTATGRINPTSAVPLSLFVIANNRDNPFYYAITKGQPEPLYFNIERPPEWRQEVILDCLPILPGGSIQWYVNLRDENQKLTGYFPVNPSFRDIIVTGDFNERLIIESTRFADSAESGTSGLYTCEVCIDHGSPQESCYNGTADVFVLGSPPNPFVTIDAMLPGGLSCVVADENGIATALRPVDGSPDVTGFTASGQLSISCGDQADPSFVYKTIFTRNGQMLQEPPFFLDQGNSYFVFSVDPVNIEELTGMYSCTMENSWGTRTDADSIVECGSPVIGMGDYGVTDVELEFGPFTTQLTVDIPIYNDNLLEFNETFSLMLFLESLTPRVTVDLNTTQITIVDDEISPVLECGATAFDNSSEYTITAESTGDGVASATCTLNGNPVLTAPVNCGVDSDNDLVIPNSDLADGAKILNIDVTFMHGGFKRCQLTLDAFKSLQCFAQVTGTTLTVSCTYSGGTLKSLTCMFPEAPVDCSDLTLTLDTSLFSAGYIEIKITAMDKDGTITTFDLGFTVTENTQAITCYTSAGCTGNVISTNILPRSCCVGNGISYHDGMDCFECILWGFQNSNGDPITQLPVSELGLSFSFEVNFTTIKGHLEKDSVRVADITSTPINASADEYSFTDVTDEFNILTTIGIYILTDSVALEGNETFSINASLVNDNPLLKPAENEFVADPLIVIIQDVNVINLEFDQIDYRIKEGTNNNKLLVTVKTVSNPNIILASELQLRIVPLTFQQQEALGIPLPPDFPPKPVAASVNHTIGRVDFNDSVRIVTVPAGQRVEDITVDIPIIDDEIDEASEGFVILLEVVDPAVAPFVDLFTRNASLGRIDDNDMLFIDFEQARYQFPEAIEIHEAVILKVNGTITEQTYLIDVSARDGSALNGFDYIMEGGDAQILPDQQSLHFQFEILEDSILESVECFTVSLECVPDYEPRFETQGAITTTKICILDRTPFVIGFRKTHNTVQEDVGSFDISVAILQLDPVTTVDPELTFRVFYSASGTADADDYSPSFGFNFLTFSNSINETFITVTITDDDLFEGTEIFSYRLMGVSPAFSQLTFTPNVSTVNITDNDGFGIVTVGFDPSIYNVSESGGSVSLTIIATGGPPANSVFFFTHDDTATCKQTNNKKHTACKQHNYQRLR